MKQDLWSRESGEQRLHFYTTRSLMPHHSLGRMCRMFSLNFLQPEPDGGIHYVQSKNVKKKEECNFSSHAHHPISYFQSSTKNCSY